MSDTATLRKLSPNKSTMQRAMSGGREVSPVAATISSKLTEAFVPTHLVVLNESHMHNV